MPIVIPLAAIYLIYKTVDDKIGEKIDEWNKNNNQKKTQTNEIQIPSHS